MLRQAQKNQYRLDRFSMLSAQSWGDGIPDVKKGEMDEEVAVNCGWGRLIFGQTFDDHEKIIKLFLEEPDGHRDLAMYVHNHHVLLTKAPSLLFVDPSVTFRLWLHNYRMNKDRYDGFYIRLLVNEDDAQRVNDIYRKCGFVEAENDIILDNQRTSIFSYFVAEDPRDGRIMGTITGIDHKLAFGDPENGSSFWSLAVDPDYRGKGVGSALVRAVAEYYLAKGRNYLDLSVLHDNEGAIDLYKSLGFQQIPVYVIKRKNDINKHFYTGGPKP